MVWVIVALVVGPIVGVLGWFLINDSVVQISSGKLGLLVVRGKATKKALLPGRHFVPALRHMTVQEYPSLELSYRAGDVEGRDSELERVGPAVRVTLGDRALVAVSYTLRVRLLPDHLRTVHERYGPDGIWSVVRDASSRVVRSTMNNPDVGIEDLFGPARQALDESLARSMARELEATGFELTLFTLEETDLGPAGEVVQATVRSRLELAREEAEAPVRLLQARNDAELLPLLTSDASGAAMRYRENDVWRDIAQILATKTVLPGPARSSRSDTAIAASSSDSAHLDDDLSGEDDA